MELDAAAVHRLAALARLRLEQGDAERLAVELSRIVAYVEQLDVSEGVGDDAAGSVGRRPDVPAPFPMGAGSGAVTDGQALRVPIVIGAPE